MQSIPTIPTHFTVSWSVICRLSDALYLDENPWFLGEREIVVKPCSLNMQMQIAAVCHLANTN